MQLRPGRSIFVNHSWLDRSMTVKHSRLHCSVAAKLSRSQFARWRDATSTRDRAASDYPLVAEGIRQWQPGATLALVLLVVLTLTSARAPWAGGRPRAIPGT